MPIADSGGPIHGLEDWQAMRKGLNSTTVIAILTGSACLIALAVGLIRGDDQEDRAKRLKDRLRILRSVPYTSVTREEVEPDLAGVTLHDKDKAYQGYNLYVDRLSGSVALMDMDGVVVHRWTYPDRRMRHWEHAVMLDNGDVIAKSLHI